MAKKTIELIPDIKKYIIYIKSQIDVKKIILFGSYAKGNQNEESDIDLAIVSPQFGYSPLLEKIRLYELKYDADIQADIEPVPIGLDEYEGNDNFFINEIKKEGIDITNIIF
jgi:uncharacterized protein